MTLGVCLGVALQARGQFIFVKPNSPQSRSGTRCCRNPVAMLSRSCRNAVAFFEAILYGHPITIRRTTRTDVDTGSPSGELARWRPGRIGCSRFATDRGRFACRPGVERPQNDRSLSNWTGRRGRVERYLKHGLAVLVAVSCARAMHDMAGRSRGCVVGAGT